MYSVVSAPQGNSEWTLFSDGDVYVVVWVSPEFGEYHWTVDRNEYANIVSTILAEDFA